MRVTLLPLFPACVSEPPVPVILFATVTEPLGRLNVKVPLLLISLDPSAPDAVPLPICKVPLVMVVVVVVVVVVMVVVVVVMETMVKKPIQTPMVMILLVILKENLQNQILPVRI